MDEQLQQLMQETTSEVLDQLPTFIQSLNECAVSFRLGEDGQGFQQIASVVEHLQSYIAFLNIVVQQVPHHTAIFKAHVDEFDRHLQRLIKVWQSADYVLLADCLLYELKPLVHRSGQSLTILSANLVA